MVKVENCDHCGLCCRTNPDLSDDEVKKIAKYLKLTKKQFINTYLNLNPHRTDKNQLLYTPDGYCIMAEHRKKGIFCKIERVKPRCCEDFDERNCKALKKKMMVRRKMIL